MTKYVWIWYSIGKEVKSFLQASNEVLVKSVTNFG